MFEKFSVSKQLLQKVGVLKTLTKMLQKQPSEVFFKKVVLENFTKFIACAIVSFLMKLQT